MNMTTPAAARDCAAHLIPLITNVAPLILSGDELAEFSDAADAARAFCEQPATSATCRKIEQKLGVMFNLFDGSQLFHDKPVDEVQTVLDCFEIAGGACDNVARMGSLH